jgi:hypothetical protein
MMWIERTYELEYAAISHIFLSVLYSILKIRQIYLRLQKHADGNELSFMDFTTFPCTIYHSYDWKCRDMPKWVLGISE